MHTKKTVFLAVVFALALSLMSATLVSAYDKGDWSDEPIGVMIMPPPPPPPPEYGGCTPGFWKQPHHLDSWVGYSTDDRFKDVFDVPCVKTLLEALGTGGGDAKALGRHAVAALLNAANPDVNYFYTEAEIIGMVQSAYAFGEFEDAKDALEDQNEMGCPLR